MLWSTDGSYRLPEAVSSRCDSSCRDRPAASSFKDAAGPNAAGWLVARRGATARSVGDRRPGRSDVHDPGRGDSDEVRRFDGEDGPRRAGRRPHESVSEQVLIEIGRQGSECGLPVAHRRLRSRCGPARTCRWPVSTGSPTTSARRLSSTRSAPDASTSTASSPTTERKISDFTISATSQPGAAAASAAVLRAFGHFLHLARDAEPTELLGNPSRTHGPPLPCRPF